MLSWGGKKKESHVSEATNLQNWKYFQTHIRQRMFTKERWEVHYRTHDLIWVNKDWCHLTPTILKKKNLSCWNFPSYNIFTYVDIFLFIQEWQKRLFSRNTYYLLMKPLAGILHGSPISVQSRAESCSAWSHNSGGLLMRDNPGPHRWYHNRCQRQS